MTTKDADAVFEEGLRLSAIGYPEHDKLSKVLAQLQAQGQFLEWLGARGLFICEYYEDDGSRYRPVRGSINRLLAAFHDIDLKALQREKQRMR